MYIGHSNSPSCVDKNLLLLPSCLNQSQATQIWFPENGSKITPNFYQIF